MARILTAGTLPSMRPSLAVAVAAGSTAVAVVVDMVEGAARVVAAVGTTVAAAGTVVAATVGTVMEDTAGPGTPGVAVHLIIAGGIRSVCLGYLRVVSRGVTLCVGGSVFCRY